MKALSIRQPWAWLIIHGGKDVENRSWSTHYTGPLAIHAGKGMSAADFDNAVDLAAKILPADHRFFAMTRQDFARGGVIGVAWLQSCTCLNPTSPWAMVYGCHWNLRDPRLIPFHPCKGRLGLFDVELPEPEPPF